MTLAASTHGSGCKLLRLRLTRCFSSSIPMTWILIFSPTERISAGWSTHRQEICDNGSSPSTPPISTKAPKFASLTISPSTTLPSPIFWKRSFLCSACCSETTFLWDIMRLFCFGSTDSIFNWIFWPISSSISLTLIWLDGTNPLTPRTSTRIPPLTSDKTSASTTASSSLNFSSSFHA